MGTLTAQILVGNTHPYHGGITPTHALYLSENSRPAWTLMSHDVYARKEQPALQPVVWVPTVEHLLEDGVLMIWLLVAKVPQVCDLASQFFTSPWTERVELCDDIRREQLLSLHEACKQTPLDLHLAVTIFGESSLLYQIYLLEAYQVTMDICPWSFSRIKTSYGFREFLNDGSGFSECSRIKSN